MTTLDAKGISLALGTSVLSRSGMATVPIRRTVVDSREVSPGDLFVALPGDRVDGNDFVPAALAGGAAAVICSRPPGEVISDASVFVVKDSLAALQRLAAWWRSRFDTKVIAITGSVGKTTTKELTASLLSSHFRTLKNAGNQNNEVGVPLTMLALTAEHERVVTEMGMYQPGEIRLYCRIAAPIVGVVTCVRPIHLDRLGSIEAITRAKRELPEALPVGGLCILNADDPRVASMASATAARVMTYGIAEPADVTATSVETRGALGMRFVLGFDGASATVRLRLPGRHQVSNALAAAAVALADGISLADVAGELAVARDELRLRVVPGKRGSVLLDDTYNAGPDSMAADLGILADTPGRKLAVLGDMLELGEIEESSHRDVGARAARVVDVLFTVGPRARHIASAAREHGLRAVHEFATKEGLAAAVLAELKEGDHVLLKASHGVALETIVEQLREEASR